MPIPAYMPMPQPSALPQTSTLTPTPMWQAGAPAIMRTPYPTPFLPGFSQPMGPMDPSQDPGYQAWLAQRGLPNAYSASGQRATQSSVLDPIKQMAEKKATGWLEDQGKSALEGAFGGAGGAEVASQLGSSAGSTIGADVLSLGPTMPSVGPTITNAANLPVAGESSLMSVGLPAGVALATILAGRSGLRMLQGKQKNWKNASLADNAGRVALATGTFGMSEIANKLFGGHRSTRDRARGNTSELLDKFKDDPQYQDFVKGMRAQYDSAPPDPSKPFGGGRYATWDEYTRAGLDAGDLTGVKGNLDLGQEYTRLTPEQKKAFTQMQIDKRRYNSRKGEVESTDINAARNDLMEFIKSGGKAPAGSGVLSNPDSNFQKLRPVSIGGATQQGGHWVDKDGKTITGDIDPGFTMGNRFVPDQVQVQRSSTRSPGIDKNGNRISYGRK